MVLFCLLRQACDIVDAIDIFFLRTDPSPPDLGRKACFRSVTSLGGFGYSFALTQAVVYPILFHIDLVADDFSFSPKLRSKLLLATDSTFKSVQKQFCFLRNASTVVVPLGVPGDELESQHLVGTQQCQCEQMLAFCIPRGCSLTSLFAVGRL